MLFFFYCPVFILFYFNLNGKSFKLFGSLDEFVAWKSNLGHTEVATTIGAVSI